MTFPTFRYKLMWKPDKHCEPHPIAWSNSRKDIVYELLFYKMKNFDVAVLDTRTGVWI